MALRPTIGLIAISTLLVGWQSGNTVSDAAPPKPPAAAPQQAPIRYEFSGGSFVTFNRALPAEVIEAASGQAPARPVLVWAGNESAGRGARKLERFRAPKRSPHGRRGAFQARRSCRLGGARARPFRGAGGLRVEADFLAVSGPRSNVRSDVRSNVRPRSGGSCPVGRGGGWPLEARAGGRRAHLLARPCARMGGRCPRRSWRPRPTKPNSWAKRLAPYRPGMQQ